MSSWTSKLAAGLLTVAALSRPSAGAPQAASLVNASSLGSALPSFAASMPTSIASNTPTSTVGVDSSAIAPSFIAAPASTAAALSLVSIPGTSIVAAAVSHPQGPPPDLASSDDVPYPPLPADWNTNVSITNLLGTRLYGWKGCSPDDRAKIRGAYDGFHSLADQSEITSGFTDGKLRHGIDWTDQAAKDYWGPSKGKNKVSDDDRNGIQRLFNSLQQVYPGNVPFISHWIKVHCSSTTKSDGDPDDTCRDRATSNQCARGSRSPSPNPDDPRLNAYSNNNYPGENDDIVFCRKFFALPDLDTAVVRGVRRHDKNLDNYDNQALVFFHEMTHLDYFTNRSPPPSTIGPPVGDLRIQYNSQGKKVESDAYGPQLARILANWHTNRGAFYTIRNADNYAWYAMTKYVWKLLGLKSTDYPDEPSSRNIRPLIPPKDRDGQKVTSLDDGEQLDKTGTNEDSLTSNEIAAAKSFGNCADR